MPLPNNFCETVCRHIVRRAAGVGAVCARASRDGVRQASDELQRRLLPNALLRRKTVVRFTTRARNSGAIRRAKSNLTSGSEYNRLDFTAKFREFFFFRFRIAITGNGRAALRAELLAAALILSVERP
jgi:hypothetical protein